MVFVVLLVLKCNEKRIISYKVVPYLRLSELGVVSCTGTFTFGRSTCIWIACISSQGALQAWAKDYWQNSSWFVRLCRTKTITGSHQFFLVLIQKFPRVVPKVSVSICKLFVNFTRPTLWLLLSFQIYAVSHLTLPSTTRSKFDFRYRKFAFRVLRLFQIQLWSPSGTEMFSIVIDRL